MTAVALASVELKATAELLSLSTAPAPNCIVRSGAPAEPLELAEVVLAVRSDPELESGHATNA